ncbi:MAG: DUF4982 domain-containing protein [Clostridia bacterium]|nr:DUF4982 domain-containing protein [Clostridia bacterium]
MKKICINNDWLFTFENQLDHFNHFGFEKYMDAAGAPARFYEYSSWQKIDLPHDWAVGLKKDLHANTFAGARANSHFHRYMTERRSDVETVYSVGWYRKRFFAPEEWAGRRVFIEFEGVFRDCAVWVNGTYLDRHLSGYTSFTLELTDHLLFGETNSVAVRVDTAQNEGWWYEGAGIYRNVFLHIAPDVYIKPDKTIIKTETDGSARVITEIRNERDSSFEGSVRFEILSAEGAFVCAGAAPVSASAYSEGKAEISLFIPSVHLWHVDDPYLYQLRISAGEDEHIVPFGVRSVAFDANKGFLLNGRPLKIRGACVHQDFGGVGVALTDNLQYYKIMRLKEMGANAYRASHNAPAPALLRACDELGMLVMDETRLFGTSPEAVKQMTDVITRDRNHPCVFIWSLGNEEFSIQDQPISFSLMKKMTRIAKALDDTRPVTYSGNNGANFIGANAASEVRGVNYIRNDDGKGGEWLKRYHEDHPDQPIIGTEEASYVLSRGGARTDFGASRLDSTGLVTMPWGSTPKGWVKYFEERDYLAGSFMWTGFDYRGEANPFITANVSSSFGTIDLCGMEKPPFYYYKAWWTNEAVLKIAPHWNFEKGETAEISVFTNLDQITLFVNGRRIETRKVEKYDAPLFHIPFEAGEISVIGEKDGKTYSDSIKTAFEEKRACAACVLSAENDDDISIFEITAHDENGVFCPLSDKEVALSVQNGAIVGVGNGDPASLDDEQVFPAEKAVFIRTFICENALYTVPHKAKNHLRPRYDYLEIEEDMHGFSDDLRRVARFRDSKNPPVTRTFETVVSGVSGYEYIEFERLGGNAKIFVNGEFVGDNITSEGRVTVSHARPYRFSANFKKGDNAITAVIETCEDSDPPMSGYVKIGKAIKPEWKVRLHFGKARVFVKPEAVKTAEVSAEFTE